MTNVLPSIFAAPIVNCWQCPLGRTSGGRCRFTPSQLRVGAVLCAQGEAPAQVSFIREGLVSRTQLDANGDERSVTLRGPGSLLFWETLTGASPSYELRALTPLKVCSLSRDQLKEWLGPPDAPARVVLDLMFRELERQSDDAGWRQGPSLARVARFLLCLSARAEGEKLQKQLVARLLGMRSETLSRCLGVLRSRGALRRGPGLRVVDSTRLVEVLHEAYE